MLRVFNDASNSVLSQQLGFAWRSVPRCVKNRYDEEASKLVKIHQLEFPNYKYQPKKRCGSLTSEPAPTNNFTAHLTDGANPSVTKLPISRGFSPEPWQNRDSAYSTRKNSCTSSSASSPQVTDFSPSPMKQLQQQNQPYRRVLFEEPSKPIIRQRFASATNGVMPTFLQQQQQQQQPVIMTATQQTSRPATCLLNPGRGLKRDYEDVVFSQTNQTALPMFNDCYGYLGAKRRPYINVVESTSAMSLPERISPPTVTLLGAERNWKREDDEEDFSFFESATESESILSSEENNGLFDDAPMSVGDLADFLPGAEVLIRGVEPLASGPLSPDLEMLDKSELLQI